MGLTKQYLRYAPDIVLNYLASQRCNIVAIQEPDEQKGGRKARSSWICFACSEIIYVWDVRRNEKVSSDLNMVAPPIRGIFPETACCVFAYVRIVKTEVELISSD